MLFALSPSPEPGPHFTASAHKVSILHRVAAKFVDLALFVTIAWFVPYPLGPLAGFVYSLAADGMNLGPFRGQSVGKRLLGLRVVEIEHRSPAGLRESVLRNSPVGVATFFALIPIWGWLILAFIGLPLMLIEISLMVRVDSGRRLGDLMGDTEVIDMRSEMPRKEPTVWPGNA